MDEHLKDLRMSQWLTPHVEIHINPGTFVYLDDGTLIGQTASKADPCWPDVVLEDILDDEYIE